MAIDRPLGRVLSRFAQTAASTVAVGAASSAQQVSGPLITLPALQPDQALKIVALEGQVFDPNQSHQVVVLAFNITLVLVDATGAQKLPIRAWQSNLGNFLIGKQGLRIGAINDEFIYGSDYVALAAAVGFKPGASVLLIGADMSNVPAVAQQATFNMTVLGQVWSMAAIGQKS